MKIPNKVTLILMAGLLAPLLLVAAVAATPEREKTDDVTVTVQDVQASTSGVTDLDRYAEREAASPDLADFAGGREEVVVVCSTCVLVVLLVLILL